MILQFFLEKREACQINFTRRRTQTKDSYKSRQRAVLKKFRLQFRPRCYGSCYRNRTFRHCQLCVNKKINGFVSLGRVFVITGKGVRVHNRSTGRRMMDMDKQRASCHKAYKNSQ